MPFLVYLKNATLCACTARTGLRYISYILIRLAFIPLFFRFLRDFHGGPCQMPLENLGKYHRLPMKD